MNLFQLGDFTLSSGQKSRWKIECDAFTVEDWEALAYIAVDLILPPFSEVIGVPRGGLLFAEALSKYTTNEVKRTIICDDVITTGATMESYRTDEEDLGIVVFARGDERPPYWIAPMFKSCWL